MKSNLPVNVHIMLFGMIVVLSIFYGISMSILRSNLYPFHDYTLRGTAVSFNM